MRTNGLESTWAPIKRDHNGVPQVEPQPPAPVPHEQVGHNNARRLATVGHLGLVNRGNRGQVAAVEGVDDVIRDLCKFGRRLPTLSLTYRRWGQSILSSRRTANAWDFGLADWST